MLQRLLPEGPNSALSQGPRKQSEDMQTCTLPMNDWTMKVTFWGGIRSMHFWIKWLPFWSSTQRSTWP